MNQIRLFRALIALIIATLLVVSPAFAQDAAKEGENVFVVKGENPEWTYVKIGERANLDTDSFGKLFDTDAASIRADNPTKTLAVCRVSRSRFVMQSGIRSPEDRARQDVWRNCPAENQKVYLVPGETMVLKGLKHLSYAEEQGALGSIKQCKDASCVLEAAQPLVPGVELGMAPPPVVAASSESQAPPPAEPTAEQPPAEEPPPPPAANPPPAPVQESNGSDLPFIVAIFLAFAALVGMILMGHRANQAEKALRRQASEASKGASEDAVERKRLEAENARLESENTSLKGDIAQATTERDAALSENVTLRADSVRLTQELQGMNAELEALREEDVGKLHLERDGFAAKLRAMSEDLESLKERLRTAVAELSMEVFGKNDVSEEASPDELIVHLGRCAVWCTQMRDALGDLGSTLEQESDAEHAMTPEAIWEIADSVRRALADSKRAREELDALLRGMQELLAELDMESDVDAETRPTLVGMDAKLVWQTLHDRILGISERIHSEVSGLLRAVAGQSSDTNGLFDTTALREAFAAIDGTYQELEEVLRQGAHGTEEMPSTVVGCGTTARQLIVAQREALASYRQNIAEQAGELAQLRSQHDRNEGSGVKPIPREPDNQQDEFEPGRTLRPPCHSAVPPAPNGSWRSQFFGGAGMLMKEYASHAIIPLENATEAGLVMRLFELLYRRRFQVPMDTGPRTFSPLNPKEDPEVWGYLQRLGAVSAG